MPERKQDGRRAKSPDRRNDEYEALRQLKAPSADARALARVLGDHDIGGFHVDVVLNESANRVEEQIEDLFAESHSEDLLLLHFSCHGLKSEAGELFFAARNTRPDRLASTAIAADFIQRCIKSCRARRIVLFLDCCYGGAFGQGVSVRASGSANVLESFPSGKLGGGKGRAVITASSSMEYAFEGNALADDHQQQPSLFTSALVRGLETGEADSDEDGLVSLNELYDYVFDKVRQQNPNQTPSRDVEMQGELYVAQSRREKVRPLPIPAEVQTALQDRNMFTRLGAVGELRARMNSEDLPAALGAYAALIDLSRTDIRYVGDAAAEAVLGAVPRGAEHELSFGEVERGATASSLVLHLSGPPIARACELSTPDRWIRIEEARDGPHISVDTTAAGRLRGAITIKGPTGQAIVPVSVNVMSRVVEAQAEVAGAELPAGHPTTSPPPAGTTSTTRSRPHWWPLPTRRGAILAALTAVLLVGGVVTWRVVDAQGHSTTIPASFDGTWKGSGPTSDGSMADFTSSLGEGLQLGRLSSGSSSCYGGPLTVSDATSSRLTTRFAPDGKGCNAWTVVFTHLSGRALQMAVDPDSNVNHESRFEIRMTRQG